MKARRQLLVADDEPVAQLIARTALEAGGYDVVLAADGAEAIRLFAQRTPDCVLLDVVMPGLDGLEACRRIRSAAAGADVPVLIITSRDDMDAVARAYDAGATDFMSKGFSARQLTERVRFLLREHDGRRALVVNQERLRAVQALAQIGHWEVDAAGRTIDLSDIVAGILGGPATSLDTLREALAPEDLGPFDAALDGWRQDGGSFRLECRLLAGTCIHVQGAASIDPLRASLTLVIQDVTPLREAQREAHRLAYYDALSGLPNRKRFVEVVNAIVGMRQQSSPLAVLALRVRGAERVLESGRQAAADRIILDASRRLHDAACGPDSPGNVLAHLGGGDFALVLPGCSCPAAAASVAEAALEALRPPVEGHQWSVSLTAQVGIALWPQDEQAADALLGSAQATVGKLVAEGRNGYAFFTHELLERARRRLTLEAALRTALERDELRLVYQPRVELADLHVAGAEALMRWRHPTLGDIPPLEFIGIAERAGLINEIGAWALDQACAQAAAWRRERRRNVGLSVNVSSQQLAASRDLFEAVQQALARHGLPGGALELELTESMVVHADEEVLAVLRELRALGVSIALDDFGTGYSSLGYLRKLPVDCLKIDRVFVSDLTSDPGAGSVLEAILGVARALGLRTVAEGIETVAQFRLLAQQGCREGQGYLFARPMEAADLGALLARRTLPQPDATVSRAG